MNAERNISLKAMPLSERHGMTMIEVVIAMVLLTGCLLSMGTFVGRFAKATRLMNTRNTASELVADRIEDVKGAVRYSAIDSIYAITENSIAGTPGFIRRTLVTHVGGGGPDLDDYKIVTVIVTSPQLSAPSKKTTIIAAF
jgi:prepilin-type N-terminal cleavage/methylation domain-containing protein